MTYDLTTPTDAAAQPDAAARTDPAGRPDTAALRHRVAGLVSAATGGDVSAAEALAGETSLVALGLDSLGMLRLIDAIELEFDVAIDVNAPGTRLDTVDDIVRHLDPPPSA